MAADPFAQADAANAAGAQRAALEGVQRDRQARRRADPMPAGGLFDDVHRATRDLFLDAQEPWPDSAWYDTSAELR